MLGSEKCISAESKALFTIFWNDATDLCGHIGYLVAKIGFLGRKSGYLTFHVAAGYFFWLFLTFLLATRRAFWLPIFTYFSPFFRCSYPFFCCSYLFFTVFTNFFVGIRHCAPPPAVGLEILSGLKSPEKKEGIKKKREKRKEKNSKEKRKRKSTRTNEKVEKLKTNENINDNVKMGLTDQQTDRIWDFII